LREHGLNIQFEATSDPTDALIASVSRATPRSPFNSGPFAAAARARGIQPCVLALRRGQRAVSGALALLSGDRWIRELTITTAPSVEDPALYWGGVTGFCCELGVTDLRIDSFAAESFDSENVLAHLKTAGVSSRRHSSAVLLSHRRRCEYVWNLQRPDLETTLSKHHRRTLQRAGKTNLAVSRSSSVENIASHLQAIRASVTRRRRRGEIVAWTDTDVLHRTLLEHGAGELFQAVAGGDVMASILILKTPTSAYYQSAGTTERGLRVGASPFVVLEAAKCLAADGVAWFNLGGADIEAAGLRRFKAGFGTQELRLESAIYSMISHRERSLRRVARWVHRCFPTPARSAFVHPR
jgi:hypothetical protein